MGTIFNIQRFCINDGPGIRTTVFIKGCPLNCLWCHNPESKSTRPELFYDRKKCVGCGKCIAACPNGCHTITENGHILDRNNCNKCFACAEVCFAEALEKTGYEISPEEAIDEVLKDAAFYENSGGGLTVSGGEPMAQFDFTYQLLKKAKEKGLHVCMETCGFASSENYRKIAPLVDIFLFDYKITDKDEHKKYTGVSNEKILENLKILDSLGAKTVLRCPIIPTVNDKKEHLLGIAKTANRLQNILGIEIEPYHPLGSGKSDMLGKDYPLGDLDFADEKDVEKWIKTISDNTKISVKKA